MKKLLAIAAAAATALSSTALSAGAMFENIPSTRIWENEFEIFEAMDSGELDTDIDRDGSFTLSDCYLFYNYTRGVKTESDIAEHADKIGDYNGTGVVDKKDAEHLTRYYILKNKMSRKETKPDYYNSVNKQYSADSGEGGALSSFSYNRSFAVDFSRELLCQIDYLMAGYPVFCDMLADGEVDYDINEDGRLFFDDINYLWVYSTNIHNCEYMDFTMAEAAQVPGDLYYPCQKAYNYMLNDIKTQWICEYAIMYCFENYEIKPEYLTNDYYEDILSGSGKYNFGKWAKQKYEEWLPQNEYQAFNGALFNKEYIEFIEKNGSDKSYIPDTNGDGVLDIYDTFNTYIYMDDLYSDSTADTTILPDGTWKFFKESCDLNSNGLSGDMHDLSILNLFILDRLTDDEIIGMYENYSDKLKEYITGLSKASGVPLVKYSPEKYSSPVALSDDMERTGDANSDGKKDMADVVFIMQALANPDKYKLSVIGRFNADINSTGDGVTLMDAQAIQDSLLGLA